jgi:beta-lactamase class A
MRWFLSRLFLGVALIGTYAAARAEKLDYLTAEIGRIVSSAQSGTVGVGIVHLETGRSVGFNEKELYPMASVVKVPIALKLLNDIDRGALTLDRELELGPEDFQPGSGKLGRTIPRTGVKMTVSDLIELMMTESDNSATDRLLMLAGGPQAVTDYIKSLGVGGVRVDRSIRQLLGEHAGMAPSDVPEIGERFGPREYGAKLRAVPRDVRDAARLNYQADPRDTSTPLEMSLLLAQLAQGKIATPASTEYLLGVITRTRTGVHRLKGMLPPGTIIGHKTGTVGSSTNDVGIITLPEYAGRIAISVFIKGSNDAGAERERIIAHISRAAYDYFLFNRQLPVANIAHLTGDAK